MDKGDSKQYQIVLTSRKSALIEGVENVESFDEEEIIMNTKMGVLVLKGQGLHINQLDLEKGILMAEGYCKSLDFAEDKNLKGMKGAGKGLWQRILR